MNINFEKQQDHMRRKKELRKQIESYRAALTREQWQSKSAAICRSLSSYLAVKPDRGLTVLAYMSFQKEVDLAPLIEWCWREGHRVIIPRIDHERRLLQWHSYRPGEQLVVNRWGIREPMIGAPAFETFHEADAMVVPGVAFDREGNRLGYGGGYYDKFFQQLHDRGVPLLLTIAPAFDVQIVDEVPVEPHDVPMDLMITESQLLIPAGSKVGRIARNLQEEA